MSTRAWLSSSASVWYADPPGGVARVAEVARIAQVAQVDQVTQLAQLDRVASVTPAAGHLTAWDRWRAPAW